MSKKSSPFLGKPVQLHRTGFPKNGGVSWNTPNPRLLKFYGFKLSEIEPFVTKDSLKCLNQRNIYHYHQS